MRTKLSKNSTRTTSLETLKNNIKLCRVKESLSELEKIRKIYSLIKKYRNIIIPINSGGISIKHYIQFLNVIPNEVYSDKPIFYYENNQWDALGLLGERVHYSTVRTKYLELCFRDVGIGITRVLDNDVPMFSHYKTEKKRFLAALDYVSENLDEGNKNNILINAKKLSDERYIYDK